MKESEGKIRYTVGPTYRELESSKPALQSKCAGDRPMLAMLSLPYTHWQAGYAHAILCWCFILAYSDSNRQDPLSAPEARCSRWGYTWEAAPVRVWAVVALGRPYNHNRRIVSLPDRDGPSYTSLEPIDRTHAKSYVLLAFAPRRAPEPARRVARRVDKSRRGAPH